MAALGAELTLVPSEGGLTTKKLILDMIEAARALSREPRTYWTDQLNNHDSIAGYHPLGEEIWSQTGGRSRRVRPLRRARRRRRAASPTVLKRHKPGVRIVVVEPAESSVLLGGPAGAAQDRRRRHRLHAAALGAGARGRDRRRSRRTTRRRWRGASRARRRSSRARPPAPTSSPRSRSRGGWDRAPTVVTLMADSGLKYLSTDVYRSAR